MVWKGNDNPESLKKLPPSDTYEQRKKKNTINFTPDYSPPDLRVQLGFGRWARYAYPLTENDVIMVPALFTDIFSDMTQSYDLLMKEMNYDDFFAWHGNNEIDGTHWILNDRAQCKSVLFNIIVDRIANYFNMDVHATRYNLYEKGDEWKPYHFDAAALDPKKAERQNITIGVSFGAERSISFQHAKKGTRIDFTLQNGMCYAFGNKVNTTWRHGVPPKLNEPNGRISIICWGYCNQN